MACHKGGYELDRPESGWVLVGYYVETIEKIEDIHAWLVSNEAVGWFVCEQRTVIGKNTVFGFSDENTAFAFKLRFG